MEELSRAKEIERSIIKRYRKELWSRFVKAVKAYSLIGEGDRIAVCMSGGKDSFLMAKLLQELQRHGQKDFSLRFLVMDPGYLPANRALILENAALLEIPVEIFSSPIFEVVEQAGGSPCYLCARMRRGYLYEHAKSLGCNKIALGHHFDDVIETLLLSVLYGGQVQGMPPRLYSTNHPGMQLIRPLYYVHEHDIVRWKEHCGLRFLRCACKFTEKSAEAEENSKRLVVKRLIAKLKESDPNVDISIFRSMYNVHVDTLIEYESGGKRYDFLSRCRQKGKEKDEENQ